jgi:preprotein translocase subunit SecE
METNRVYHFFEKIKQEWTKTGSNLTILIVAFCVCVNFCIIWSISAI